MKITRDNIDILFARTVRWTAPCYEANGENYGGTAVIRHIDKWSRRPIVVEEFEGDDLEFAFFPENYNELAYSDADREVDVTILMYEVRDREAGNVIESCISMEEALSTIELYEDADRKDNTYTEDFYEVHERELTIREVIGLRIEDLRKKAMMSQKQLAEATGLDQPHIARIEHGRYSVGLDVLDKIATALGKRIDIV